MPARLNLVDGAEYKLEVRMANAGGDQELERPFHTCTLSVGPDDQGVIRRRVPFPANVGNGRYLVSANVCDTFPGLGTDDALVGKRKQFFELSAAPRAEIAKVGDASDKQGCHRRVGPDS